MTNGQRQVPAQSQTTKRKPKNMSEETNIQKPTGDESVRRTGMVRRLGRFRVSVEMMDDWPALLIAMGQVVVVRAEAQYDSRTIDYVAYSHHFDVVADGVEPPEYTAIVTRHEAGGITVRWERVKLAV